MPKWATIKHPFRGDKSFRPDFKITTNLFCNFASVNKERKFQFNTKKRSGNKPSPFFCSWRTFQIRPKSQNFYSAKLTYNFAVIFPARELEGREPFEKACQTAVQTVAWVLNCDGVRTNSTYPLQFKTQTPYQR